MVQGYEPFSFSSHGQAAWLDNGWWLVGKNHFSSNFILQTLSLTNISISDIKLTNPWCYNTLFLQQCSKLGALSGGQWMNWCIAGKEHSTSKLRLSVSSQWSFLNSYPSPSIKSLDKLYSLPSLIALHVDPQKTLPKNTWLSTMRTSSLLWLEVGLFFKAELRRFILSSVPVRVHWKWSIY